MGGAVEPKLPCRKNIHRTAVASHEKNQQEYSLQLDINS